MADRTLTTQADPLTTQTGEIWQPVKQKLVDNGDGTFSPLVATTGGGPGGTLASQVQGNAASGATDVGNPVKVGGKYNATMPTFSDGQRGDLQLDTNGKLEIRVSGAGATGTDGRANAFVLAGQEGTSHNSPGLFVVAPMGFNGTTWDRVRGDTSGTWIKMAPQSGTDRSATLSVASSQIMAANALRSKQIFKNDTAINIFINLGATAVATAGGGNYMVAANGGYFELDSYSGVVNAIAASGTPAFTAREFS